MTWFSFFILTRISHRFGGRSPSLLSRSAWWKMRANAMPHYKKEVWAGHTFWVGKIRNSNFMPCSVGDLIWSSWTTNRSNACMTLKNSQIHDKHWPFNGQRLFCISKVFVHWKTWAQISNSRTSAVNNRLITHIIENITNHLSNLRHLGFFKSPRCCCWRTQA